jgi:hypothetical protein
MPVKIVWQLIMQFQGIGHYHLGFRDGHSDSQSQTSHGVIIDIEVLARRNRGDFSKITGHVTVARQVQLELT